MKTLLKAGVTLAALTALGLAGSSAAQAASPTTITYLGTVLNQPNVSLVGTQDWFLPNFTSGNTDRSPAISQANPLDSNGNEVLDSLGGLGSIDGGNGVDGSDTASNAAAGGFAQMTGTDPGYLGVAYDMPGQDAFDTGKGIVNTNAYMQAYGGTKSSFTFGVLVSSNAAPTTISAYYFNGSTGAVSSRVTAATIPTTIPSANPEADYYLFKVTNLPTTGYVFIDAAPSTTGGIAGISGLTLGTPSVAITSPNASAAPEPSQLAGLGFTAFGALGLILKARRRSATA